MTDHLYLSIGLFIVSIAIALISISSNMKRWRKILIVALISMSGLLSYRAMFSFYGYPVPLQESFKKVLVLGFKAEKQNNIIYLWLMSESGEPRGYYIPYSSGAHKALSQLRRQNRGKPFRVKIDVESSIGKSFKNSLNKDKTKIKGLNTFPPKGNNEDNQNNQDRIK